MLDHDWKQILFLIFVRNLAADQFQLRKHLRLSMAAKTPRRSDQGHESDLDRLAATAVDVQLQSERQICSSYVSRFAVVTLADHYLLKPHQQSIMEPAGTLREPT